MLNDYSVLMLLWYKENPEYLKASIESMAKQTVPPVEFVLVLDHDISDELAACIAEAAGSVSVHYVDARDLFEQGLGALRARGVEQCSCELVACMDSDDIAFPDRCARQLEVFRNNPGLAIVGGITAEFIHTAGNIVSYRNVPENHTDIMKYAKLRNPFNQPSVMFRKAIVLGVGNYNPRYKGYEDYELWYRLLKNGHKGYNIPEPIVYYRAGDQLIKHRGEKKNYISYKAIKKKMRKEKFINWFDYQISVNSQRLFYYSPFFLKKIIYKVLRKI